MSLAGFKLNEPRSKKWYLYSKSFHSREIAYSVIGVFFGCSSKSVKQTRYKTAMHAHRKI